MKSKVIFILVFFSIILLSSAVSAFVVEPDGQALSLCPRESGLFTETITNTGNIVQQYEISVSGPAANWATLAPKDFFIKPGETEKVYTYITPNQNTKEGKYNLNIKIITNSETKEINKDVYVRDCYNVVVSSLSKGQASCPGKLLKYEFVVANIGEKADAYTLSLTGDMQDKITLSDTNIALSPGESKTVYTYVNTPAKDGDYFFSLNVKGTLSEDSKKVGTQVIQCYDYESLIEETEYELCEHSTLKIPVQINNKGTVANNYKISLKGQSWMDASVDDVVVSADASKQYFIGFAPDYGVKGVYQLDIRTIPEYGEWVGHNVLNVTVRQCHNVQLEIKELYLETCTPNVKTQSIYLTNTGEFTKNFLLTASNYDWITFEDQNVTLNPGEGKAFNLYISPTNETKSTAKTIKIKAEATDDSKVSAEQEFRAVILRDETCHGSLITTDKEEIYLDYNQSELITITIEHAGVISALYNLSISGIDFAQLSASKLNFDYNQTKSVYVYIAPKENITAGEYDLYFRAVSPDTDTVKKFSIYVGVEKPQSSEGLNWTAWGIIIGCICFAFLLLVVSSIKIVRHYKVKKKPVKKEIRRTKKR